MAFLNSSFGQIQFEIHANNQEGLRKLEGFMIEKLEVIDQDMLTEKEIDKVLKELDELNSLNQDFIGTETENPRYKLDATIAEIIFNKDNMGFTDSKSLNDYFENFLKELVLDRANKM